MDGFQVPLRDDKGEIIGFDIVLKVSRSPLGTCSEEVAPVGTE